jgi:hypothetical protein
MMSKLQLIKINQYNMNQLIRMNLYQLKGKLLVMVKHFIWMKICCYRLRASKLAFPISVFCLFRILDDQLAPCLLNNGKRMNGTPYHLFRIHLFTAVLEIFVSINIYDYMSVYDYMDIYI